MIFYHALTKVTFKIKKGKGFTAEEFTFTNENNTPKENIVLKDFNTSGTFSITNGTFTSTSQADITSLYNKGPEGDYAYVLEGLLVPGSVLNDDDNSKIYFTINHNTYHLTKNQLKTSLAGKKLSDYVESDPSSGTDALTADHKMRPGVHYIFEMTVGKVKVPNFCPDCGVPLKEVGA